jgi:cupin superfamily acireductone dioxygenase involved in methionine salvage
LKGSEGSDSHGYKKRKRVNMGKRRKEKENKINRYLREWNHEIKIA